MQILNESAEKIPKNLIKIGKSISMDYHRYTFTICVEKSHFKGAYPITGVDLNNFKNIV